MDDVICDFKGAHEKALILNPKIQFPQSQYGFFLNLKPIDLAIPSLMLLSAEFDVMILSKPSVYNPLSYTEKRFWIEQHLGFKWCEKLILCTDKTLLKGDTSFNNP